MTSKWRKATGADIGQTCRFFDRAGEGYVEGVLVKIITEFKTSIYACERPGTGAVVPFYFAEAEDVQTDCTTIHAAQSMIRDLVRQINDNLSTVRMIKDANPSLKVSVYKNNVGSILNGYREGDVTFEDAVSMLRIAEKPIDTATDSPPPRIWSDQIVFHLNSGQHDHTRHGYTCGNDSRHRPLIATPQGWRCADCDYEQDFAHGVENCCPECGSWSYKEGSGVTFSLPKGFPFTEAAECSTCNKRHRENLESLCRERHEKINAAILAAFSGDAAKSADGSTS